MGTSPVEVPVGGRRSGGNSGGSRGFREKGERRWEEERETIRKKKKFDFYVIKFVIFYVITLIKELKLNNKYNK